MHHGAAEIERAYRRCFTQPFIGEIHEYASKINLQDGYARPGLFDVTGSRYLIDVFLALRNPRIRSEVTLKAVQTGGSLASDLTIPWRIEHDPGGMLLLLQDDDFAKKYCDTRLMPMLYSIREIARILDGVDKHSKTKTEILFPGMTLSVGGLNEGNVQSLSWRYVTVDEGWLAKSNGLIRQAIARTTDFPYTSKFHLISQAGIEDDDLDLEWKQSNQKEWAWLCKGCGRLNIWEWTVRRDDNSFAGMLWDTNERTKPDGRWNFSEVLPTVRLACRYCPEIVLDLPENRRRLDATGEYVITNPGALPERSGHHWPALASPNISFVKVVEQYLNAKFQDEEYNYKLPLREFYQKRLARAWSENVGVEIVTLSSTPYDPKAAWPKEKFRFILVDCQKDFTKLYVLVLAWSADGEVRELYWECRESFDQVEEVQHEFNVPYENVFVDLGYEQTKVAEQCVKRGELRTLNGKTVWKCWQGLKGSDTERFPHRVKKRDAQGKVIRDINTMRPVIMTEYRIYSEVGYINPNLGVTTKGRLVPFFMWSNLHAKDIVKRYRDGKAGRVEWLPDDLPITDLESATNQMHSEARRREVTKNGKSVNRWVQIGKRPNHKWDDWSMGIVVACIAGIIGGTQAPPAKDDLEEAPAENQAAGA